MSAQDRQFCVELASGSVGCLSTRNKMIGCTESISLPFSKLVLLMKQISRLKCSFLLCLAACAADPVDARAQATCDLVPDASSRVWCGPSTYTSLYPSEAECQSKRCCFDPSRENSTAGCTYPSYKATPLKKVMVVQASHFDAGFLNSTVNIINLWFT